MGAVNTAAASGRRIPGWRLSRDRNWHALFRQALADQHGRVDARAYHFIHGYFNAAMALNTTGRQRLGRLLRAMETNAVLATPGR